MKEIEVKILGAKHIELENKLFSLGAKKVFEGELFAIFFEKRDAKIKTKKQVLRLRKEKNKIFMTFKSNFDKFEFKICDEIEFEVSSFEKAKLFLEKLGYSQMRISKKIRISYHLKDVHFDFDKYLEKNDFIPEFMEIEAKNSDFIYKYAKMLGFGEKDCKNWSFSELKKYYVKSQIKHLKI